MLLEVQTAAGLQGIATCFLVLSTKDKQKTQFHIQADDSVQSQYLFTMTFKTVLCKTTEL